MGLAGTRRMSIAVCKGGGCGCGEGRQAGRQARRARQAWTHTEVVLEARRTRGARGFATWPRPWPASLPTMPSLVCVALCARAAPHPTPPHPRGLPQVKADILDWHGDHVHTNYHGMFNALREK